MNGEFLKIIAAIIITALFSLILKGYRPEYSFLLRTFLTATVTIFCIYKIYPSVMSIKNIFSKAGVSSEYFFVTLKALGIAYITSFAADSCRDAGESALAAKAELAGKCAIFIITVPLILNVLQSALRFASL